MKIIWTLLISLFLFQNLQAQTEETISVQQDLMKKSDQQYKAAWILMGAGVATSLTSIAIPVNYDYTDGTDNSTLIAVLGWTGFLSISTSIPLFLASGRNARTAAKLTLQTQAIHQPLIQPSFGKNYPALSLKIPLYHLNGK